MDTIQSSALEQGAALKGYYKWHAKVYQLTRWTFLFGRRRIIHALEIPMFSELTVLEVGCGTGYNLNILSRFYPNLQLIGLDLSPDMLNIASQKLSRYSRRTLLLESAYGLRPVRLPKRPDVILFSYCLTMINPGWKEAIQHAYADLPTGGRIAVVDFHGSPFSWFRKWMRFNHVRMEEHLLPYLKENFELQRLDILKAYAGLWTFFIYIGKKKAPESADNATSQNLTEG
ncbi:MAG: class I SAM-dependent methyltransferase [Chitinophagales bacterium]|nr:class I SAM-dependent methyltransferase [Chitinophagales bacterium]